MGLIFKEEASSFLLREDPFLQEFRLPGKERESTEFTEMAENIKVYPYTLNADFHYSLLLSRYLNREEISFSV